MRLQVAISKLGFSSRRKAAELVKQGRVKVNNKIVKKPYKRVNLEKDKITVDGKKGKLEKKIYYILNKPKNVISTVKDKYADKTVLDLINYTKTRLYPVGRLDKNTTGLLILTNDGDLTYHLTHPKFEIEKVYEVKVENSISNDNIKLLENGIILEDKKTYPCRIDVLFRDADITKLKVILTEGRKRQIKKMFTKIAHPVISIHRTAFGPLELKKLKPGQYRLLKNREVQKLKQSTGLV